MNRNILKMEVKWLVDVDETGTYIEETWTFGIEEPMVARYGPIPDTAVKAFVWERRQFVQGQCGAAMNHMNAEHARLLNPPPVRARYPAVK